jgi:cytochrome c oxidase subunit 4
MEDGRWPPTPRNPQMTDPTAMAPSEIAEEHATEAHAPYLTVWAWLAVLTAVEYFYAYYCMNFFMILILGLLFLAVVKAGLVGWFFMHLKFEGNWVYIMIVPAFVLATILVMALLPDMAMKPEEEETAAEQSSFVIPTAEHPGGPTIMSRLAFRSLLPVTGSRTAISSFDGLWNAPNGRDRTACAASPGSQPTA